MSPGRAAKITAISIGGSIVLFALLAYQRRWISDDGMIVVRTVREILAGNGPVYNAFERAEADTSALWTWLLALAGLVSDRELNLTAVILGGACSVLGVAIALDATRRWHRDRGTAGALIPAGILVVLAVFPFWDFATSGLETGLTTLWLAVVWWVLVDLRADHRARRHFAVAMIIGLGPLVRPDLGLVTVAFGLAAWLVVRPRPVRTAALVAAAFALPAAYEVFRAGFYGALVPLPALAKDASGSAWSRGFAYLRDYAHPYRLWFPFTVLAVLGALVVARRGLVGRDRLLVATPLVTAALMAAFVVRVGGDFMHARMLLPATWVALFPVLLVPLRRWVVPAAFVLTCWAVVIGIALNDHASHVTGPAPIEDEHVGYAEWTRHAHPIMASAFVHADRPASDRAAAALRNHQRRLIGEDGVTDLPLASDRPGPLAYMAGRLGTGGAVAPLDAIAVDTLGLANPLGARIVATNPGQAGHEKPLPPAWAFADYVDPAADIPPPLVRSVRYARHAMGCGALAELLESTRAPLTWSRWWANVAGAVRRTRLVIPDDPGDADFELCGASSIAISVTASSSLEVSGWSRHYVVDGLTGGFGLGGYSSVDQDHDHTEWLELRFPTARPVSTVVLYPAPASGELFPRDFTIKIWDGTRWVDRVQRTDYPPPGDTPQALSWSPPDTTDRVRIYGTKLNGGPAHFAMRFGEVEVH